MNTQVTRLWAGSEWITVVNHPWDAAKVTPYDPMEAPHLGDLRAFNSVQELGMTEFTGAAGARWVTECNCDPGEAYGHHVWCDTYRPQGMTDADWEAALKKHPFLNPYRSQT